MASSDLVITTAVSPDVLKKFYVAQQKSEILKEEYKQWKVKTMDATISEISTGLPPIPPSKYLKQHTTLTGHSSKVVDIEFSPDSNKIFSVCQDGFGIIWDVLTGLKLQAIPLVDRWALSCSYSPSGRIVALAGLENKCTLYPVNFDSSDNFTLNSECIELSRRGQLIRANHQAYISVLQFLSERELLTGSGDSLIRLWDVERRCKITEFTEHSDDISAVLISLPESTLNCHFISASADGSVRFWDKRLPKSLHSIHLVSQDITALTQLPDGHCFVSGDERGICQLYDIRSLCPVETYDIRAQFETKRKATTLGFDSASADVLQRPMPPVPPSPGSAKSLADSYNIAGITSLDLSKSGRIMYACYADYGCISWDLFQKKIIEKIGVGHSAHQDRISHVRVSRDGQGLATASWDSTIKIWTV